MLRGVQHVFIGIAHTRVAEVSTLIIYYISACSLTTNETIDISYVKSFIPDFMKDNKIENKQTNV